MQLKFCGAAREVTGSSFLLEVNGARILVDCGMFQGKRADAKERNQFFLFDPTSIDVVVLTHAHIDHSGNLPSLVRQGYQGPIYATDATRDLCSVMLMDSAHIQSSDAKFFNRKAEKLGLEPIEPLYTSEDVLDTMKRFVSVSYELPLPIANGVTVVFHDAGHVLGSSNVELQCQQDDGAKHNILFSGDVGRDVIPLLPPPTLPSGIHTLVLETTYGNREHEPYEDGNNILAETITRTANRRGKIIIPTFALERAQEVVYALKTLLIKGKIPQIPVYVDSPLTCDITEIYRLHPECFNTEITSLFTRRDSPFFFPDLTYIRQAEHSKALNNEPGPMLIMSANGMCEAGRILHHLRNNIEDARNTILFVGYQAEHTLGRKILEGEPEAKIFGIKHPVEAEVVALSSLSGHADKHGLREFALATRETCKNVFLVHGEFAQQKPMADWLRTKNFPRVEIPERNQTLEL